MLNNSRRTEELWQEIAFQSKQQLKTIWEAFYSRVFG